MSRAKPRFYRYNYPSAEAPLPYGIVRMTFLGSCEGFSVVNDFAWEASGVVGIADVNALLANVTAIPGPSWLSNFLAMCSPDYTLSRVKATLLSNPTVVPVYHIFAPPTPGTRAGAGHTATQLAPLLSLSSNIRGQSGRGRVYMPPTVPTDVVGTLLQPGYVTLATAFVTGTIPGPIVIGGLTWTFGLFNQRGTPVPPLAQPPAPKTTAPPLPAGHYNGVTITGGFVRPNIATRRRRTIYNR